MKLFWKIHPTKDAEDKIVRIIFYLAVGIWIIWGSFEDEPRHKIDRGTRIIFDGGIAAVWFGGALRELISLLRLYRARRRNQKLDAKNAPRRENPN